MLKKPFDPSQDGPRLNNKHIENRLRYTASRTLRDRNLHHQKAPKCIEGADVIPLVPYDKYLWSFLDYVESHSSADDVSDKLRDLSIEKPGNIATPEKKLRKYPDEIDADIKIVMSGMNHIYTDSGNPILPRIQINEEDGTERKRPTFLIHREPHHERVPGKFILDTCRAQLADEVLEIHHRCSAHKVKCHDEREYEWLKAFLKVVIWIEENETFDVNLNDQDSTKI